MEQKGGGQTFKALGYFSVFCGREYVCDGMNVAFVHFSSPVLTINVRFVSFVQGQLLIKGCY